MPPATARQVEYAMALGVVIPSRCDKDTMSPLIDAAVQKLDDPPNDRQLQLAKQFEIPLPSTAKTSRDVVELLYDHLKARRWVFSVIRHCVKADWKRYSESGLPAKYANEIASALKRDKKLMAKIERREGGNHLSGGDVWYRITDRGTNSPEYMFVKNYDLPDDVLAAINVSHLKRAKGGCLFVLLMLSAPIALAIPLILSS